MPVALDPNIDPHLPEFVTEQRIEFLVMARPRGRNNKWLITRTNKINICTLTLLDKPNDPWGFPDEETLQKLYDKCRTDISHVQIMDVVL